MTKEQQKEITALDRLFMYQMSINYIMRRRMYAITRNMQ